MECLLGQLLQNSTPISLEYSRGVGHVKRVRTEILAGLKPLSCPNRAVCSSSVRVSQKAKTWPWSYFAYSSVRVLTSSTEGAIVRVSVEWRCIMRLEELVSYVNVCVCGKGISEGSHFNTDAEIGD